MNRQRERAGRALLWARVAWLTALALAGATRLRAADSASTQEYLTDVWTADDGLPDSSVTAIAQTPDGYLWIGTYNGVARFDGVRFVSFDPVNTPALAQARVRTLSVDSRGTLWINTLDGSMTSMRDGVFSRAWTGEEGLDPDVYLVSSRSNEVTFLLHKGILRRRTLTETNWEELTPPSRSVGTLCLADGSGTIWYRGADKLLWRVEGNAFEPHPETNGFAGTRVNCMTTDPQGRLWIGTDQGIQIWDGTRFETVTPTNAASPADVEFLSVANGERIWAGVDGRVREAIGRRWIVEAKSLRNVFTANLSRMGAKADHRGGVWLYDYGRGLTHIDAEGRVLKFGPRQGFPGERVNCFFEDHEGNWWAGLDAEGLVRIRERRFQTVAAGAQFSARPARTVCEDTNGDVWIGTLGDGLERWSTLRSSTATEDGQAGSFTNFTVPGGTGKGFVFSICPDAAGRLWASAGDEDLYVLESNRFRRVLPGIHGVKVILADHAGRIWTGTKSGLYVAGGGATNDFQQNPVIGRNVVRALAEDARGTLWAGDDEGTLFRITTHGTSFTTTAFQPTGLRGPHAIWSLLAEPDGTVWAGTFRGGLLRFRDGKFTRFGTDEGLPDDIICQILDDGAGSLWIGSQQGVFRVAKSALNDFADGEIQSVPCTVFGRSDGLPSLECSGGYQPAAWRDRDGRLWFTTLKGAVFVQPDQIRPDRLPPPVVIEDVLVDGKSVEQDAETGQRPAPAGAVYSRHKKFLEVPPGKHQIEIRYTGLSLVASDRVQFRYRLEGTGEDWIAAGTRRFAQYNFLPPGNYRFQVIACNSDGVWNQTGDSLSLKIQPYFYQTAWFQALAGLLAAGLVAGAAWYAVARRLHRKMERLARQQAVEHERARIAKDIHDDLGANLTLIAVLGDLAKQEKTVERVEKMAGTARQAVKSLDEIVWAVNPRNDTLAHLIDYTGQFAVDYLRAAGVRCLLDVPEHTPEREISTAVRHNVFLVVKEALQNIVKHARATEVWLRVNATDHDLKIIIEDNGSGFAVGSDEWRVTSDEKDSSSRSPLATPQPSPFADGLRNMRQRMSELGGECRIQSRVGAGTEIIVELPWRAG